MTRRRDEMVGVNGLQGAVDHSALQRSVTSGPDWLV
jgi:hypothetical protein